MTRIGPVARLTLVAVALVAAVVVTRWAPPSEGTSGATVEPATASSSSATVEPTPTTSQRNSSAVEPWEKTARSFANRYSNTKGGRSSWLKRFEAPQVLRRSYTGCGSRMRAA